MIVTPGRSDAVAPSNVEMLLQCVATNFGELTSLPELKPGIDADLVRGVLPYAISDAVYSLFYYGVPASRNEYIGSFRLRIALQISRLFTGLDLVSTTVLTLMV